MNRDLSKFETNVSRMPKITCAACGSPNVSGYYNDRSNTWSISCPDCGVSIEMPDNYNVSELENEVNILNFYEKLRYQVNKSKEEARRG
jgi:transcription elongation factor Elf1